MLSYPVYPIIYYIVTFGVFCSISYCDRGYSTKPIYSPGLMKTLPVEIYALFLLNPSNLINYHIVTFWVLRGRFGELCGISYCNGGYLRISIFSTVINILFYHVKDVVKSYLSHNPLYCDFWGRSWNFWGPSAISYHNRLYFAMPISSTRINL